MKTGATDGQNAGEAPPAPGGADDLQPPAPPPATAKPATAKPPRARGKQQRKRKTAEEKAQEEADAYPKICAKAVDGTATCLHLACIFRMLFSSSTAPYMICARPRQNIGVLRMAGEEPRTMKGWTAVKLGARCSGEGDR